MNVNMITKLKQWLPIAILAMLASACGGGDFTEALPDAQGRVAYTDARLQYSAAGKAIVSLDKSAPVALRSAAEDVVGDLALRGLLFNQPNKEFKIFVQHKETGKYVKLYSKLIDEQHYNVSVEVHQNTDADMRKNQNYDHIDVSLNGSIQRTLSGSITFEMERSKEIEIPLALDVFSYELNTGLWEGISAIYKYSELDLHPDEREVIPFSGSVFWPELSERYVIETPYEDMYYSASFTETFRYKATGEARLYAMSSLENASVTIDAYGDNDARGAGIDTSFNRVVFEVNGSEMMSYQFKVETDSRLSVTQKGSTEVAVFVNSLPATANQKLFVDDVVYALFVNEPGLLFNVTIDAIPYAYEGIGVATHDVPGFHFIDGLEAGEYMVSVAPLGGDTVSRIDGIRYDDVGRESTRGENVQVSSHGVITLEVTPWGWHQSVDYTVKIERIADPIIIID